MNLKTHICFAVTAVLYIISFLLAGTIPTLIYIIIQAVSLGVFWLGIYFYKQKDTFSLFLRLASYIQAILLLAWITTILPK